MQTIRYDSMVIGGSNQSSTLVLSDYESHCGKEDDAYLLGLMMAKKSQAWIIDGDEPIKWLKALLELLKGIRDGQKKERIFIKLKSKYTYFYLKSASLTNDILDYCDVLTNDDVNIDLRAAMLGEENIYWKVE